MTEKTAKDLVAEANKTVETLSADSAVKLMGDPTVVFVDLREPDELQKAGRIEAAVHVPRGLLEFQVDPTSPTHKPDLGGGKKLILFCGSGSRSALGAVALTRMGFTNVAHVSGGFPALAKAGARVADRRC